MSTLRVGHFASCNGTKHTRVLVLLLKRQGTKWLCVPCAEHNPANMLRIVSNCGNFYADALHFFSVTTENLMPYDNIRLINPKATINKIIQHNINYYRPSCKMKQNSENKERDNKKPQSKRIQEERRLKMAQYAAKYELAVMNNDRSTMQEIESIIGCDPRQYFWKSPKERVDRKRTVTNPHPLHGGKFSSK